ncbi:hypothetical protein NDU88_006011 [Pleurodeles waltl]|uniref:Uncharacterized protein n=1 Tax=Pleurodeles waltl TaxID=8319 RepID=A0AAV7N7G2_PLEWA|nr:hypothetical protein NDU88_006011 [Pleurodeles waltl]
MAETHSADRRNPSGAGWNAQKRRGAAAASLRTSDASEALLADRAWGSRTEEMRQCGALERTAVGVARRRRVQ